MEIILPWQDTVAVSKKKLITRGGGDGETAVAGAFFHFIYIPSPKVHITKFKWWGDNASEALSTAEGVTWG